MIRQVLWVGIALMALGIALPARASAVGSDFSVSDDGVLGLETDLGGIDSGTSDSGMSDDVAVSDAAATFGGRGSVKLTGSLRDAGLTGGSVLAEGDWGNPLTFIDTEILVEALWNTVDSDSRPVDDAKGFGASSIASTDLNSQASPIPEPASIALIGAGLIIVARRLLARTAA